MGQRSLMLPFASFRKLLRMVLLFPTRADAEKFVAWLMKSEIKFENDVRGPVTVKDVEVHSMVADFDPADEERLREGLRLCDIRTSK